jgi:hypothetical protein
MVRSLRDATAPSQANFPVISRSRGEAMHSAISPFNRSRFVAGMILVLISWLATPVVAEATPIISLTLSPNTYTVPAGGQFTLSGFFSTSSDALTWTQGQSTQGEFLFGLAPNSPHLGLTAGSFVFSQDFNPPVGGASFEDIIGTGSGGYLGPLTVVGPTITPVSLLRTFVVPLNVSPGTYFYSYGVAFTANTPGGYEVRFDTSLRVNVTAVPEPVTLSLVASGLVIAFNRRRRS